VRGAGGAETLTQTIHDAAHNLCNRSRYQLSHAVYPELHVLGWEIYIVDVNH
jgi:hypothetical protein